MPGTFSPPSTSKEGSWHASRRVRHARSVMQVKIANPRWRGKRSRHSRRMHIREYIFTHGVPDNKFHGANMGPTWVLSAPGGPHVGHEPLLSGNLSRFKFRNDILYCNNVPNNDLDLENFQWNCSQVNVRGPHSWPGNIKSGYVLVTSGNTPLINVDQVWCRHMTSSIVNKEECKHRYEKCLEKDCRSYTLVFCHSRSCWLNHVIYFTVIICSLFSADMIAVSSRLDIMIIAPFTIFAVGLLKSGWLVVNHRNNSACKYVLFIFAICFCALLYNRISLIGTCIGILYHLVNCMLRSILTG